MQDALWDRIEKLAVKLKVSNGAFRVWKSRGFIPGDWHLPLLEAGQGTVNEVSLRDLKSLSGFASKKRRRQA